LELANLVADLRNSRDIVRKETHHLYTRINPVPGRLGLARLPARLGHCVPHFEPRPFESFPVYSPPIFGGIPCRNVDQARPGGVGAPAKRGSVVSGASWLKGHTS